VSLAVQLTLQEDRVVDSRIVLGGVATIPWRVKKAEEAISGKTISEERAAEAASEALNEARPLRDNVYKIQLVRTLMKQAFSELQAG
jgi:xanthine dehydrogenase YagS FAD-binding subunit